MKQVCKECLVLKDLCDFYKHKLWKNWVFWRCKDCVKKWRKWFKERAMARIVDKKRIRPEWYAYIKTREYREKNPKKYKAHQLVYNFLKKHRDEYVFKCSVCWVDKKIELHHNDYDKPNFVIPLCALHHKWYHHWKNSIDINNFILFPF